VRFSRFTVVGGLCAVLSNVTVIVLARHGLGSILASVIAFGPVLLIGYALHSSFTFGTQPSKLSFVRYTLAMLANFPLWAASLGLFSDLLKFPVAIVAPATTGLLFLWNYVSARWAFLSHVRTGA
jgi:putative flippase GtrA